MTIIPGQGDFDVDLVIPPNATTVAIDLLSAEPSTINLTVDTDEAIDMFLGGDGPSGEVGPTGPPGAGIRVTESSDFPPAPQAGDVWVQPGPPRIVMVWDGVTWQNTIAGPTGPNGPTGPTGSQGLQGVPGGVGSTGPTGPAGELWWYGTVPPNTTTPAAARIGDWYLQQNGDVFERDPVGWLLRLNMRGSLGPTGATGPTGPSGGPTGPTGPPGGLGQPGPMGPTGSGGPVGTTGPTGPAGGLGPAGPAGPTGATGPAVASTTTNLSTTTTPGTGWSLNYLIGIQVGGLQMVNFKFYRTGADLVPGAKGDLPADNRLCTLPVGWRPIRAHWCLYAIGGSSFGDATLEDTGQLQNLRMLPDTQISNGNDAAGTMVFSATT